MNMHKNSESGNVVIFGLLVVAGGFLLIAFVLGLFTGETWVMNIVHILKAVFGG